jgi:ribose 5-phosphate isomerase B
MIYLGSDHAGFELKEDIARVLEESNQEFVDLGPEELDPDDDYPDYAFAVGQAVADDPEALGILACGSAQGMCIAANKVKGVRAVAVADIEDAIKTRQHNDANVLCVSGWNQSIETVEPVIDAFLSTDFTGEERHMRRLGKIVEYENGTEFPPSGNEAA